MSPRLLALGCPLVGLLLLGPVLTTLRSMGVDAREKRARSGRVLDISATEFGFVAPASVSAGPLTIRLQNDGSMVHQARLVRLEEPWTLRDLERELIAHGQLPDWAVDAGGPVAGAPDGRAESTLVLEPGRHVILCAERVDDGTTAVMKGMYQSLDVVGAGAPAAQGAASATIELPLSDIVVADRFPHGSLRVRVLNRTAESAELLIYRVNVERSVADLFEWLTSSVGRAPAEMMGGMVGLPAGGVAILGLGLPAGEYVLVHRRSSLRGSSARSRHGLIRVR